jgi:hypothetical protein
MSAKVGDIQVDRDGSRWIVIALESGRPSRVREGSLAAQIHGYPAPEPTKEES